MIKKVILTTLCVAFLATTAAFAEDVYATKNGKKYHKADCRLIKNKNPEPISLDDAKAKGLAPCRKCFKDEVSSVSSDEAAPKISSRKKSSKTE